MSVATRLKAMFLVLIEEGSSTVGDNEKTLKDAGIYEDYENANANIDKNNKPQAVAPIAANEEEKSEKVVFDVENLRKRLEKRVGGKQPHTIDEKPKSRLRSTVENSIDEDLQK